jgi:DNA-binding NarL/FixJ family response regulator
MKNSAEAPTEIRLYIAGANTFNNDVLSHYLEAQTGLPCQSIKYSELPGLLNKIDADSECLVFLDCRSGGAGKQCMLAASGRRDPTRRCKAICFNVYPQCNLEAKALKIGVKGILYNNQCLEHYPRAVKAVLKGELFFPRDILEKYIMADDSPPDLPEGKRADITRRERQVLQLLASGLSNEDISKKLFISPHTVKTHLYNLYKKINVTNRYQATKWLLDHRI